MSDGLSAGRAESKIPKTEKQKAATTVPNIKEKVIISTPSKNTLAKIIKKQIKSPKKTEAKTSPSKIAHKEIGEDINLSKVLILVSQGAITGVIAETAKKRAIPNKPEIRKSKETFLLNEKEINKNAGINKPWITTGPLK